MLLHVCNMITDPGHIQRVEFIPTTYNNSCINSASIATLSLEHKSPRFVTDLYVINHVASTIIDLLMCTELIVLPRVEVVSPSVSSYEVINEFSDVFTDFGFLCGEHHIEIVPTVHPAIYPSGRILWSCILNLK